MCIHPCCDVHDSADVGCHVALPHDLAVGLHEAGMQASRARTAPDVAPKTHNSAIGPQPTRVSISRRKHPLGVEHEERQHVSLQELPFFARLVVSLMRAQGEPAEMVQVGFCYDS